jgi:hypothetical protein
MQGRIKANFRPLENCRFHSLPELFHYRHPSYREKPGLLRRTSLTVKLGNRTFCFHVYVNVCDGNSNRTFVALFGQNNEVAYDTR